MIEGQQFEFLGFTLNPVIRMAIMRKVCILHHLIAAISYHFSLLVRNGATLINLESAELLYFYCGTPSEGVAKSLRYPRENKLRLVLRFYRHYSPHPLPCVFVFDLGAIIFRRGVCYKNCE